MRMRMVTTRVADCVPDRIVSLTRSSLPLLARGSVNESRAVPLLNDSACLRIRPPMDGSQIIAPFVSGAPVSPRVTRKVMVSRFPTDARVGVVAGAPITGRGAGGGAVV